jgi:hypothetical protein
VASLLNGRPKLVYLINRTEDHYQDLFLQNITGERKKEREEETQRGRYEENETIKNGTSTMTLT